MLTNRKNFNFTVINIYALQIKLVNINAADVVDGKPSIVLGLIWTIILYFQVRRTKINIVHTRLHLCSKQAIKLIADK
jgi:hypothetical protein